MKWRLFLFLILMINNINVSAYSGLFEVLDETYIKTSSELTQTQSLTPEKNWQPSNWADLCKRDKSPYFIFSWIDIVGYRNAIKVDSNFYINESPEDAAIIRYESHSCVFLPVFKLPMQNKIELFQEDNMLVAKLTSTQRMFSIYNGYYSWYNLTQTFYDYEPLPIQIQDQNEEIKVVIRERNFSIINSTDISIKINNTIYDRYLVKTDNGYYEKIHRLWCVENTSKGVNYANASDVDIFKADNISHSQNLISVNDLNFTVTANGFYHSTDKLNVTRIYEHSDPTAQFLSADLLGFLAVLSCFYGFFVFMRRQLL